MITRQTWTQLAVFLVISVLGVTYTGLRYAGLDRFFVDTGYLVSADFVDSGGIFEAAEVTYRGVPVGAVEEMTLIDDGVRVTMRLRPGVEVPDDARALVANRSAIGEQYVDLEPQRQGGPFMDEGFVIPQERTAIPISPTELIVNLDDFVSSVDTDDLGIVLDELGQAFDGTGESLQALVDDGNVLTQAALDDIEPTRRLIRDGETASTPSATPPASSAASTATWPCSPRRSAPATRTSGGCTPTAPAAPTRSRRSSRATGPRCRCCSTT
jgi:phospholipid/cholesterol/gamma-HCH transport system substrate-binding protein